MKRTILTFVPMTLQLLLLSLIVLACERQVHGFLTSNIPPTTARTPSHGSSVQHQVPLQRNILRGVVARTSRLRRGALAVERTDEEWRECLTDEQYYVLRKEGTETPGASELNYVKEAGTFCCAGCGAPLFVTDSKFDSGTGWPSFTKPISSSAISHTTDFKLIFPRTECSCSQCGGHLGHVFGGTFHRRGVSEACFGGTISYFSVDHHSHGYIFLSAWFYLF
jgi:peptide-methionine (R)-S-oxide reductase